MAIIYEVDLKVAQTIAQEYLNWLRCHLHEMLKQTGFLEATIYQEVMENDKTEHAVCRYIVQYTVASREMLDHYFEKGAPMMRQQGIARFGDKFTATRRVLMPI